mgnify:CR=1 FL=1
MEIGELESNDLGGIIKDRFKKYCRQHGKYFTSKMFLGPGKIILKCYLTDEDSREISSS